MLPNNSDCQVDLEHVEIETPKSRNIETSFFSRVKIMFGSKKEDDRNQYISLTDLRKQLDD